MSADLASTVETLRSFALSLPGAWEDFPWEEDRTAKVGKKIFTFLGGVEISKDHSIAVKLPESAEQALSLDCCEPSGYGLGKWNWVTVHLARPDCPPVEVLLDWIEESYRTIASKSLVRELDAREG